VGQVIVEVVLHGHRLRDVDGAGKEGENWGKEKIMNEAEWLTSADPTPMLKLLRGKASDRKLRLFAVACCKRIRGLFRGKRNRQLLEAAERFADNLVGTNDLEAERSNWLAQFDPNVMGAGRRAFSRAAIPSDFSIRLATETATEAASWIGTGESRAQARLLRDIFGNPFTPCCS